MIKKQFLLVITFLLLIEVSNADSSPDKYAIASAHPVASKAGQEILNKGGNAFDAAIAVTATLAVVEPYSSGIGGGGFWLLHRARDKSDIMIDGREKAPLKAHRDLYLDKQGNVIQGASIQGALSSGIPGVPAAIAYLANHYGELPLSTSLAPAIRVARQGYRISQSYRLYAKLRLKALRKNKAAAAVFLYNNDVPPENFILKQPDLAKTLELIAQHGHKGFYSGETAEKLVADSQRNNGIWIKKDLQQYEIAERKPITFNYLGYRITSAPPPSSGGVALAQILGILEHYNLPLFPIYQQQHLIVEAMRRAYADRAQHLGDSDFVTVPVTKLISRKHSSDRINDILLNEATPSEFLSITAQPDGNGTDTTHFSILDKEGNRVSATLSINYPFGSCHVAQGTGVLLNDEMDDFSAKPGVPNAYGLVGTAANAIAPGKRPLSSMSPTFVESDNSVLILGTPGGSRIISMVLLGILEFVNGEDANAIVSKRRFHHQYLPDFIMHEDDSIASNDVSQLQQMGHKLKLKTSPYGAGQGSYGNMQVVLWNKKDKKISAASDPRGHGLAITGH